MKRLKLLLLSLLLIPSLLTAQTTVKGTVATLNGDKLALAHVHLYRLSEGIGSTPIKSVEVGKDGTYTLSIDTPGLYRLVVTGVNHDALSVPVVAAEGKNTLTLDMRPSMLNFNHAPDQVMIVGDWNDFDFAGAEPMTRGKDGTFTYTLKTKNKDVHYQLLGIAENADGGVRSVNAPTSNGYVYDGGGDYRSVQNVKPGTVTIRFNPGDLPIASGDNEAQITYSDPSGAKLREIDRLYTETMNEFRQTVMEARDNNVEIDMNEIWGPYNSEVSEFLAEENPKIVRQFAALHVAKLLQFSHDGENGMVDDRTLATIRTLLPVNSPLWGGDPALATVVFMTGVEDQNEAIMSVVKGSPDKTVRGIALSQLAMNAYYSGNTEKALEYYRDLKADYSDVKEIDYVLAELNPDKRIQKGKEVPDFEVALIADGAASRGSGDAPTMVSKASMKGKYYMIDFWATWCGPCVGEMESLHAAYKKFGGENFQILSVSFDARPEDVAKFRAAKWKMPWLHTFATGNFNSGIGKMFEVSGIPKPVLVDPKGVIVATEDELRGEDLEKTLTRYLGDGQASR